MKKNIIEILICAVMFLGLTGCGNSNTLSELNKTVESKNWNITMKNIEFSESYCKVLDYNFLTSNTTYEKDGSEFVCSQQLPESGKKFLLFEMYVEYVGKENTERTFEGFQLNYNDGYKVNAESVYISSDNKNWTYIDGEAINHQTIEVDALENPSFTIRGAFEVNEKIETDEASSLIINMPFNVIYKVR